MKRKNKFLLFAAAGAMATIYSAIEGRGIFNKMRFAKVHDALSRYLQENYPAATYSPIEATKKGYVTTVSSPQGKVILYITASPHEENNNYIFEEMPI